MIENQDFDKRFQLWKKDNPNGTFSKFFDALHVPKIISGGAHATLGTNLKGQDWRYSGKPPFDLIQKIHGSITGTPTIPSDTVICDYGCGTLRIGAHFMRVLDPGNYIGLDISKHLVEAGAEQWSDLVQQKAPLLGAIGQTMDQAIDAAPDIVFAFNVACHIHPDETAAFYDRIKALAHKPGAMVILHVQLHDTPVRYRESGWAYPRAYYEAKLAPLEGCEHPFEAFSSWSIAGFDLDVGVMAFMRH